MFRKIIITIFFTAAWLFVEAQEEEGEQASRVGSSILNDSAQNVYGPHSTEYFFYKDILYNTGQKQNIDTSVYDLHQYNFVDYHDKHYQDLGNTGTAIAPIFYEFSDNIGLSTGFNVYDLYFDDASKIRFLDTRSPYSRLGVIIGGQGRSVTEVGFSRNINPRLNFGFNYRGIFMDKQVERARRGDRNVQGVYYNFHGNFTSGNTKYQALASFVRNNQEIDEYGGIRDTSPGTPFRLYYEDTVKVSLGATNARDLRREYFYYHEYHLTPIIEIFHELRHYDQMVGVTSAYTDPDSSSFPTTVISIEEIEKYGGSNGQVIDDWNKFDEWSNKLGIAGTVGSGYYKAYAQRRNLNFDFRYMNEAISDSAGSPSAREYENLAGAMVRLGTEEDMQLTGQLEYLEGGYYNAYGKIALKFFYGSLRQTRRKPSFIESAYRSTLNEWYLTPSPPVVSEGDAGISIDLQRFQMNTGLRAQRLTDHIYFINEGRNGSRAVQNSGTILAFNPYMTFTKWWGEHWLTTGEVIYSKTGGDNPEVYPMPKWFTNFQFSYNNINFDGNLEWQAGIDFHWKSEYYAKGYDPFIQQFYVQNEFLVPGVPVVDVFLNARINRGRLFVKYTNLFQLIEGYGYFPTPYYPGQVSTFDFGFNWSFYD